MLDTGAFDGLADGEVVGNYGVVSATGGWFRTGDVLVTVDKLLNLSPNPPSAHFQAMGNREERSEKKAL